MTFYGRHGHSDWFRRNWPELHQRWRHWVYERCEFFSKYEPLNPLRDEPIQTHNSMRLIMDDKLQRAFQNHMLRGYFP